METSVQTRATMRKVKCNFDQCSSCSKFSNLRLYGGQIF